MLTFAMAVVLDISLVISAAQPAAHADPLPPGARVRFGNARFSHSNPIVWVGFAEDGKTIISSDQKFHFWDAATRKELTSLKGGWALRDTFALSADGKTLVNWDYDKEEMRILTVSSRKENRRLAGEDVFGPKEKRPRYGQRFIVSPNGRFLAVGDKRVAHLAEREDEAEKARPGFLHIWDLDTGRRIHELKSGSVFHAEFTADSKRLIAHEWDHAGNKGSLRSWDIRSGNELARVELPRQLSRFIVLPDGKSLLGLSKQRESLHRYETATGKEIEIITDKGGPVFSFALSPNGENLAIAQPGRAVIQQLRDGKVVFEVQFPKKSLADDYWHYSNAEPLAFDRNGKTLAIAKGRTLELWDVATATRLHPDDSMGGPVLAVHANGHHLLARGKEADPSLWDMRTGKLIRRFAREPGGRVRASIGTYIPGIPDVERLNWAGYFQAISPDGKKIAAVWRDSPIHLFGLDDGKLLRRLEGSDAATSLAFSPDGKLLAGPMPDGRICIWDTTTGKQTQHFTPPLDEAGQNGPPVVLAIRFSANGKRLTASTGLHHEASDFLNWELATGNLRPPIKAERRRAYTHPRDDFEEKLTFSLAPAPDGKHIAVASLRSIRILDFLTGKEVRRFGGRDVVGQSAAFSPDGKYLVAGLDNGGIRFWNAATGAVLHDVPAHAATITSLAFADEGKTLVSGSLDGTAIAWDMNHLLKKPAANRADLETLWTALGRTDGEKAAKAMQAFADRPTETPAFFRDRLRPASAVDPKRLRQWVKELQSNQFPVRTRANDELEKLGEQARAALEAELRTDLELEPRRRIEAILQKLEPPFTDPEVLRAIRAIEVLERIGNAEARTLLESLAAGGPGHRLTDDARAALDRLSKRP
jgi:WD40 repeat protein